MKRISILLCLLFVTMTVTAASIITATKTVGGTGRVATRLISSRPCKLFATMGYNGATNTQYLFIFETANALTNGGSGRFGPFPVGAMQFFSVDLSAYGADMDAVTVGMSTTDTTFTSAATNSACIQGIIANTQ